MLAHSADHPYLGQRLALLTQHGKEAILAPVLDAALGCQVMRVENFDTDTLGTFTRDIARAGSQIEAARRKARIGMELSGLPLGLASEGAFGADPFLGTLPWNTELLLFVDDVRGIEVTGLAQQATCFAHTLTGDWQAARLFAEEAGFPEHHLVLRPAHQDDARIEKGIADWSTLAAAFAHARDAADNGLVFLEHDARAHAHPTRREAIRLAAENLRDKLLSLCPACGTPGFWLTERLPGLPCADCGTPTRETRAEVWGCLKCDLRETRMVAAQTLADPGRCDYCNP
jgi:peptidoglycan/xylan/chitin deacetylase (PgdA/CDA1 family)